MICPGRLMVLALLCSSLPTAAQSSVPVSSVLQCEDHDENHGGYFPNDPRLDKEPLTTVKFLGSGDWLAFDSVNFLSGEYDTATFYFLHWGWDNGHRASLVLDSLSGPTIAEFDLWLTSGYQTKATVSGLAHITGFHRVYLTFEGADTVCWQADRIVFSGTASVDANDARDYYVSPDGDDANNGLSPGTPFRTIQAAATRMKPGSRCLIRQGVYRETVTPWYTGLAGAPLSFEAYGNEDVFISGADPITGWTRHEGNIFKAPMPWSMGEYNDQVLVDGEQMYVARAPNIDDICNPDPWAWSYYPTGLYDWREFHDEIEPLLVPTRAYFNDNGSLTAEETVDFVTYQSADYPVAPSLFNHPVDFFANGLLTMQNDWWAGLATITASTSDEWTTVVTARRGSSMRVDWNGTGFISHLLPLLDAPREFLRVDGTVYLWAPDSDDPSEHLVEAKRRVAGFDLTGKQYVNIKGIRFIATSATLEDAAYCVIDDCHFKYPSFYEWFEWFEVGAAHWDSPEDQSSGYKGVYISGHDNVIRNSTVSHSAGSGVVLSGFRNTVTNCRIHDCNWLPTYDAGIFIMKRDQNNPEEGGGMVMTRNTVYNCGRGNIAFHLSGDNNVPEYRCRIQHNDLGRCGWLSPEMCAIDIYGCQKLDVSYNRFHGVAGFSTGYVGGDPIFGGGKLWVHHNVFYRGEPVLRTGDYRENGCTWVFAWEDTGQDGSLVFHNTIVDSANASHRGWDTEWPGFMVNNIYASSDTVPWRFSDPDRHDYSLRANSPAIDSGVVLPDWIATVTGFGPPSHNGARPDLGAFEFGETPWTAGADWDKTRWDYPPGLPVGGRLPQPDCLIKRSVPLVRVRGGSIALQGAPGAGYRAALFDGLGKTVASVNRPKGGTSSLGTRSVAKGVYFLKVSGTGTAVVRKVSLNR